MSFRENLKAELRFRDMKVKELSAKTGISKRTIDHYLEENSSEPTVSSAVKIAAALDVSVEYLVIGKDRPQPQIKIRKIIKYLEKLDINEKDGVLALLEHLAKK